MEYGLDDRWDHVRCRVPMCVCARFTFTQQAAVSAGDSSVINLDVCQNTPPAPPTPPHTDVSLAVWFVTHLQMDASLGLGPEANTFKTFPFV